MLTNKKIWLSFIILVFFVMVVTNCGGGGGGEALLPPGEKLVSLSTVTALYPTNGANWNDYVKNDGSDYYTASDIACAGTEAGGYSACLHGGEMRTVMVTGKASCAGLTASDSLGAFNWICSAATGTAQFISTGLKDGKYLSDLRDFSAPGWKANSVTVADATKLYSTATSTTWWSNPVVADNDGGSLATPGTIYAVTSSVTGSYSLDASKIALVSKPGTTITGPGAGTGSYVIKADGTSGGAKDFLWFEGKVDATGDDAGVSLATVRFSVLNNVQAEGAIAGNGVSLNNASNSKLQGIVASRNENGVVLIGSSGNRLDNIAAASNNMSGVYLGNNSNNNRLSDVMAMNNGGNGVEVYYSSRNALTSVSAANSGSHGIYLYYSSNNTLVSVIAANGAHGVYLESSSNNTLISISAANNGFYGVYLGSSSNNVLASVSAANNGAMGVYLNSSSNNTLGSATAANNNTYELYLNLSSNNKFTGLLQVGIVSNCSVTGGINPGLADGTCANNGASDATLVTGITLASSFVGKVSTDDTANTSDTNGWATYGSITDWTIFQNPFRGWGMDGSPFPNSDNRSQCTTGNTCRIWDLSLATGDTVIRNVLLLPPGTNTLTHTWSDATITTFLRNAVELTGNSNSLCESGETCLYTPNIGAYQGHGNLVSAGTFTDGTITGVTLMKYETNGR